MRQRLSNHIKNLLLPCLVFSIAVGILSAVFITLFKLAAEAVIHLSTSIYDIAQEKPIWLPLLILGAAIIGLISSFILSFTHSCRGGGIPTSVAAIRGLVNFNWVTSTLLLPFSALLSFLSGLPLGTEGPCVQMGTAIGGSIVKYIGHDKYSGWRRYIMTGGASAGFSLATASPVTAIIFSIEELHKRFSPMLITVASLSVISAQVTSYILALLGMSSDKLFHIANMPAIEPKLLFAPLIVGIVCGAFSILFSYFYTIIDKAVHSVLSKISIKIAFPVIFACVALIGFFLSESLGTGHSLIDQLLHSRNVWYTLLLVFLVRSIFTMTSNTAGVTGGIFLPTLAFGAILGSVCAEGMIAFGWIGQEHYTLMVVLGISAFLASTSRIPVTACVFAIEAMGGINNILAIIISNVFAILVVELSGLEDFTDTVIEAKLRAINKGKKKTVVEVALTVNKDSFVVGKELRDILWPASCVVVSFKHSHDNHEHIGISEGDIITVHYKTHYPAATAREIEHLVGKQSEHTSHIMNPSA